jgi:hypothetical protein
MPLHNERKKKPQRSKKQKKTVKKEDGVAGCALLCA